MFLRIESPDEESSAGHTEDNYLSIMVAARAVYVRLNTAELAELLYFQCLPDHIK